MIILDTNVLSELMRGARANLGVLTWIRTLDEQPVTTVISRAELLTGIALLPTGSRRAGLAGKAAEALSAVGIVLPVTEVASDSYAEIVAARTRIGRPIGSMDALIAAIAVTSNAAVATRNTPDFEHLGLRLINPWGE